ncbi:MAG: thiosulfate oxidation carrier complex protein SoxZ [Rhodospirillales bacterium]|nr:thiosulfate oxidation carrier complex protein SoxZ [Rhodospirillales bacterium]
MIDAPRIHVPSTAEKGEVVRVRAKIPHPMETGWRKDHDGKEVPRNRINRFVCTFNGTEVFSADMFSGVSADPYLSFFVRVEESGTVACTWEADEGKTFKRSATINVA